MHAISLISDGKAKAAFVFDFFNLILLIFNSYPDIVVMTFHW